MSVLNLHALRSGVAEFMTRFRSPGERGLVSARTEGVSQATAGPVATQPAAQAVPRPSTYADSAPKMALPPALTLGQTAKHFAKSALSYALQFEVTKLIPASLIAIDNDSFVPIALALGPWLLTSVESARTLFFQVLFESGYGLTRKARSGALRSPGLDVLNGMGGVSDSVEPLSWDRLLRSASVLLVGERHHVSASQHSLINQLGALKRAGLTHVAVEMSDGMGVLLTGAVFNSSLELYFWARLMGVKVVGVDRKMISKNASEHGERNGIVQGEIAKILASNPEAKIIYLLGSRHMIDEKGSESVTRLLQKNGIAAKAVLPLNPLSLYDRMRFPQWMRAADAAGVAGREVYYENAELTAATGVHGIANVPHEETVPSWLFGLLRFPRMARDVIGTRRGPSVH